MSIIVILFCRFLCIWNKHVERTRVVSSLSQVALRTTTSTPDRNNPGSHGSLLHLQLYWSSCSSSYDQYSCSTRVTVELVVLLLWISRLYSASSYAFYPWYLSFESLGIFVSSTWIMSSLVLGQFCYNYVCNHHFLLTPESVLLCNDQVISVHSGVTYCSVNWEVFCQWCGICNVDLVSC